MLAEARNSVRKRGGGPCGLLAERTPFTESFARVWTIGLMTTPTDLHPLRSDLHATTQARWRTCFEVLENRHAHVTTDDVGPLAPIVSAGLRASLPTFQIGETGTGSHLLAAAAKVGDEDYVEALRLFVKEEQEHARLLALVCNELDIEMLDDHWTDGVFQCVRRAFGLRGEVLTLLVAEFVSNRFYELLAEGVGDPVLSAIFDRIHQDEMRHLDFHAATLPEHLDTWSTPVWKLARAIWLTLIVGSTAVVAVDHRKAIRACGSSPLHFFRDVVSTLRGQHGRFFQS